MREGHGVLYAAWLGSFVPLPLWTRLAASIQMYEVQLTSLLLNLLALVTQSIIPGVCFFSKFWLEFKNKIFCRLALV